MRGKRYPHIMAPTKGAKQPDALIGLATTWKTVKVQGSSSLERLLLTGWHATLVTVSGEKQTVREESQGQRSSSWWTTLERWGKRYRHLLVCSSQAVTDWSLLDLWEGIEDDRLRIAGDDGASSGKAAVGSERQTLGQQTVGNSPGEGGAGGGRRDGVGLVVTEDPPSILYAFLNATGSLVRWVDCRNYGIPAGKLPQGHQALSRELARILGGMVATLACLNLGALKDTGASQALYSFRKKHLKHLIVCHCEDDILNLEKAGYYSGRCECGRIGRTEGPVYELDIRGSYCYTCLSESVPVRLRSYCLEPVSGEMPDIGGARGIIGTVCLETDEPAYPLRRNALTVWPTGRFVTTLCGPELLDAWEKGRITRWLGWAEYDLAPALSSYASEVYTLREHFEQCSDVNLAQWAKALAVSIVGKLGQRGRSWKWLPDQVPRFAYDQYHDYWIDGRVCRYQAISGWLRVELLEGWAPDAVPAIAGWICSSARMRLLSMLRCAGSAEVWYMDTDCLLTTDIGYQRLVVGGWVRQGGLGFLQVKGCHEWIDVRGVKSYRLPSRNAQSGFRSDGKASGEEACAHRYNVWVSTFLARKTEPSAQRVTTKWERVTPYLHGHIAAGGRVKPFHLWED